MQYFERDTAQMNMPLQYYPTGAMPQQLEKMYPKIYYIIKPTVEGICCTLAATHGPAYIPTREQIEAMIDSIYSKVEKNVDAAINQSSREEERQIYGGGKYLLRDLIGVLLIGSLIRRTHPYYYGYPGFHGDGFGGYPYY